MRVPLANAEIAQIRRSKPLSVGSIRIELLLLKPSLRDCPPDQRTAAAPLVSARDLAGETGKFARRGAAHAECTSSFAHSAARSLIRSYLRVAGLPFRTMVAFLRSSRGKVIARATAERNLMEP